ncbi:hypothetical protein [Hyphomicrobium sp. LHD-15]|uniref:hypothetical protein n=1 Tax=Hyphomicrobium sp. LHD-15 TaxID=3072142 RepID=UPI0028104F31|nr:hypothetical protein [Hyphomicrobium sp. LHD-15]MDQ8700730.1 hypothetical protein [Hyphomicrobium sp. LHD-15]
MGAQAEPLLYDAPNPDAPDLAARLEALQELLDASRAEPHPAFAPTPETATAPDVAPQVPMPKFLLDGDGAGDALPVETNTNTTWRETLNVLSGHERAQWMFFIATVMGSAALLVGLELYDFERAVPKRPETVISVAEPTPPEVRLNFLGEMHCDQSPCDALSTAIPRTIASMPIESAESVGPGIVFATNPGTSAEDPTTVNPLDTVTVTGLPPSVRLSVGQKTSDTEWTLAAGDLNDIAIVVPNDHAGPVRANIEIRKAAGEPIASLGLTIEREAPPAPAAADPLLSMAPIDPIVTLEDDKIEETSVTPPTEHEEAAPATTPAKPAKPLKAKVRQQKKVKPQPQPVQAVEVSKPPATLLEMFQGQTKQATAPASSPTPKASFSDDGGNNETFTPPPTTTLANEPAGFETLRGLGGGFGLQPQ